MAPIVRPYQLNDLRRLEATIEAVCRESSYMATAAFQPTPAWQQALSGAGSHGLFVIADGEQVVGWCRIFAGIEALGEPAELGIGLRAGYRSQRLGTALIGAALQWAREKCIREVCLQVDTRNLSARRLFARSGFQPLGGSEQPVIRMKWKDA